jgi:hypothetical protein
LLPLPAHHWDTAQVVYRVVNPEGWIDYRRNHYSVPWRYIGELLPVRITEDELLVYNAQLDIVAKHAPLSTHISGQTQIDPAHRPPRSHHVQIEQLQQRFAELGDVAARFLEGLLRRQRYGKHQAIRVLSLLRTWHREDLLAAMDRAVRYHAYSLSSLERILAIQATPKALWQTVDEDQEKWSEGLPHTEASEPNDNSRRQCLLFEDPDAEDDKSGDSSADNETSHDEAPDEPP